MTAEYRPGMVKKHLMMDQALFLAGELVQSHHCASHRVDGILRKGSRKGLSLLAYKQAGTRTLSKCRQNK
jgi:hypothetical protein